MRASRFLAALADTLPAERLQHGRVERAAEQIADAQGNIGLPWIADGPLARMQRKGEISAAQHFAGLVFHTDFRNAALDPLKASDLGQRLDAGRGSAGLFVELARRRVNGALDALGGVGSPCGSAVWHIVGLEDSIGDWARRAGWSGRPLRHETAKMVLCGALSVLSAYYKLERT